MNKEGKNANNSGENPTSGQKHPAGESLIIADGNASDYCIVISKDASPSEHHAAKELQEHLQRMTGATLTIKNDQNDMGKHEIMLGQNSHTDQIRIQIDTEELGDEGFIIRTKSPHLVIAGSRKRGTLYGVYAFLEEQLGCRWFTPTDTYIPKKTKLEINRIDDRQVPILEYRDVFFYDARNPEWAVRNRVNGTWDLPDEYGGKFSFYPFGHSFWTLIPPDKYFESHPEWFSLVDGERTLKGRYVRTQLCLTNEEMTQQAIRTVKEWIGEHPEARVISVSQNDGPGGWCECEKCAALEEREGGAHSAPIINFVNRIADAIAEEHPDVLIDTFAYSYSRKAPKTLRPRPNVVIRLTTGGCCSHVIGDVKCILNAGIRQDIADWFRLTNRIYVWDYIVNFRQYLMPFPNIHILGPNIRFLVENGVRGIFQQGSGGARMADMAPLKAYLSAKLLWNPDYDVERGIEEFLDAYFGDAAGPIEKYIDLLKSEVQGTDYHSLHVKPFEPSITAPYLNLDVMKKAWQLFDEAERGVDGDPDLLARVKTARLPLDYVKLRMASRVISSIDPEDMKKPVGEWYEDFIEDFFATAKAGGVTHWREVGRPQSSMDELMKMLVSTIEKGNGS